MLNFPFLNFMNRKLKKSKKLVVGDLRHRGPLAFRFGVNKGEVLRLLALGPSRWLRLRRSQRGPGACFAPLGRSQRAALALPLWGKVKGHPVRELSPESIRRLVRQKEAPGFLSQGHLEAWQGKSQTQSQWLPIRTLGKSFRTLSLTRRFCRPLGHYKLDWRGTGTWLVVPAGLDIPTYFFFFQKFAGTGFEPMTSRLWALRATKLLYPAGIEV